MFTSLLLAGTFLGRLTGYVVDGVPANLILQAFALLLPAIMVKTFSMAVLLAALLSFGRLSSDSEITAMRAGGASLARIVRPMVFFGLSIALLTFIVNETLVPFSSKKSLELAVQLANQRNTQANNPFHTVVIEKQKLRLGIVARNVNPADRSLQGVTVISYDEEGKESFILLAKTLSNFQGLDRWEILGGATLLTPDGRTVAELRDRTWPDSLPRITDSFTNLVKERDDDFDALSMQEIQARIKEFRERGNRTPATIANYEYGYWNKLSVPLASVVFGVLGAVLGIRNHRTGTAAGFALAVGIIFGYVTLANFMAIWAQGGVLPAWAASFAPLIIGTIVAAVILVRKDQ